MDGGVLDGTISLGIDAADGLALLGGDHRAMCGAGRRRVGWRGGCRWKRRLRRCRSWSTGLAAFHHNPTHGAATDVHAALTGTAFAPFCAEI
jgi:hypothetical protein